MKRKVIGVSDVKENTNNKSYVVLTFDKVVFEDKILPIEKHAVFLDVKFLNQIKVGMELDVYPVKNREVIKPSNTKKLNIELKNKKREDIEPYKNAWLVERNESYEYCNSFNFPSYLDSILVENFIIPINKKEHLSRAMYGMASCIGKEYKCFIEKIPFPLKEINRYEKSERKLLDFYTESFHSESYEESYHLQDFDNISFNYNFSSKKNEYPIIKIPESIISLNKTEIPVFGKPNKPIKPTKSKADIGGLVVIGVALSIIELVIGFSASVIIITLCVITVISIIQYISISIKNENNFNESLNLYEKEIQSYHLDVKTYNDKALKIQNPKDTLLYRNAKIKEAIKQTIKPYKGYPNLKKGTSESYFFNILINRFPGHIFQNYIIEKFNNKKAYQPDFIYQDRETNLHIDIEIDEPYIFNTKNPIHYIYKEEGHIDASRDFYFNGKGWVVIRFAEEQIVKSPEECCDLIARIIYDLTNEKKWLIKSVNTLLPIPCWSFSQAKKYSKVNYREQYLLEKKIQLNIPSKSKQKIEIDLKNNDNDDLPF